MSSQQQESIASEVLAASLGGAVSASILYPLEVLKTKMQASEDAQDLGMWEFAQYLVKHYGFKVFWVGVETSALQSATEKALYFFAYTALKELYHVITPKPLSTLPNLVLGCAAEWAHLPITLPIDCWTTTIQTNTTDTSAMTLLCNLLSEKGIRGMYKGIQAYTVLCLKPAIQYTVFEQIKQRLLKGTRRTSLHAGESFVLGMVARTISTILVFPYVRAKVLLQTTNSTTTISNNDSSILSFLLKLHQQQGFSALFQGLGPELTRGVLSSALMLMIKEQIASLVHASLYGNNNKNSTLEHSSGIKP
jgi:hypothetical protein